MPLINETFESLPGISPLAEFQDPVLTIRDIDPPVPPELHEKITASLLSSLPPSAATHPHPSLPSTHIPNFPPLISAEHARLASGAPKPADTGIDTSRYESLSSPSDPNPSRESWKPIINAAATSHSHLLSRSQHLQLLEAYGKNAWLIGNWQTEAVLGSLERELEVAQGEEKKINEERKAAQDGVRGEIEILEETWKKGVGRALEAGVAAEELRRRVLKERRKGATAGAQADGG